MSGPPRSDAAPMLLGRGLAGQGVVVTGAGGGIGQAVAVAFADAGARVMMVDADRGSVERVGRQLRGSGHVVVAADLRAIGAHQELVARARRELGSLRVLAHLAAVLRRRDRLTDVSEADWDLQVDTNLKASFFLCRTAAEAMVTQGTGGRIITFSSQGWWTGGFGGSVVYNATKGAIVTLTRGLARAYGPHGITVNSVAPGQVRTPMLLTDLRPDVLAAMTEATPLGRVAEPEELAGLVVFLASDWASFITGATVNATGGFLMY